MKFSIYSVKNLYIEWTCFRNVDLMTILNLNEPPHQETNNLHMQKQRRRPASQ